MPSGTPAPRLADVIEKVSDSHEETARVVAHLLRSGLVWLSRPGRCREL